MSALEKSAAENIYRMGGRNAWIFADDADIWIIRGPTGLTISVWARGDDDPLDSVYITWDKLGEKK